MGQTVLGTRGWSPALKPWAASRAELPHGCEADADGGWSGSFQNTENRIAPSQTLGHVKEWEETAQQPPGPTERGFVQPGPARGRLPAGTPPGQAAQGEPVGTAPPPWAPQGAHGPHVSGKGESVTTSVGHTVPGSPPEAARVPWLRDPDTAAWRLGLEASAAATASPALRPSQQPLSCSVPQGPRRWLHGSGHLSSVTCAPSMRAERPRRLGLLCPGPGGDPRTGPCLGHSRALPTLGGWESCLNPRVWGAGGLRSCLLRSG